MHKICTGDRLGRPRLNPVKFTPIALFYIGTLLVCSLLIAAPTLYIYNALRPAPPASIRSDIVRATDPVAPLQTKGPSRELDNNNRPLAFPAGQNGDGHHGWREPVHGNLHCANPVIDFILTRPLLALYCGLAVGIIWILICAVDCKLSCWRGYDNKF